MMFWFFSKGRSLILFFSFLVLVTIIYVYINNLQVNFEIAKNSDRCMSELKSLKYQLNVVTEYKNKIDRLLTEKQKSIEADKEKFKDIMESCGAMKQQVILCQSQFEDLQSECKKVKENYDKLRKDTEK